MQFLHRQQEHFDPHYRIRKKLERWKLPGTPRVQGDRFQRFLYQLKSRATPRVQAAVLKLAWNGWGTCRRFQGARAASATCLVGRQRCAETPWSTTTTAPPSRPYTKKWEAPRQTGVSPFGGTATAHKRIQDCNINDAKSAYATFITTNAARRRGGISAEEAGTIFRDSFLQAGAIPGTDTAKRASKREKADHSTHDREAGGIRNNSHLGASRLHRPDKRARLGTAGSLEPPRN